MGFSELLATQFDTLDPKKARIYAEAIYESSASVDKLLKSLTLWSRSQEGRIQLNKESFRLCVLFTQNIELQKLTMNRKEQAKIFRIDQSSSMDGTEGEKGSGMGLVIVQDFVLKNGGEISVNSEMGKGSTFTIKLPQDSPSDHKNSGD